MIPYLPTNRRFPTVFSLRQNSQSRGSFISALSIVINLPLKTIKLQEQPWNYEVQLNKVNRTAAMLIDDSENLSQRYERIRRKILSMNGPPNPAREWTGDFQILHHLFDSHDSGMKQQMSHLLSEAYSPIGDLRDGYIDRSISRDVWTILANQEGDEVMECMPRANEKAWTKLAGQALNDMHRLMRHVEERLPKDSGRDIHLG